jgi:hypothetical protein
LLALFSLEALRNLTVIDQGPCVSIYLPTHRIPTEIEQDRLRLKNLLGKAEESLMELGLRSPEAKAILQPAETLLLKTPFWKGLQDGLAIFLAPGISQFFSVPLRVPELMVVGERFHLKPLLALLSTNEFYLLALSQNEVRFFQASQYGVSEMDLEGVPRSLAEALKYDDPQKQLQFHTGTQRSTGERAAIFHGHGVGTDDAKSNLLRFCQHLDRGLHDILRNEQAPLVVAGVDFLLPIFREANSYKHLLSEGITGNPEGLSPEELQRRAWPVVEPYFNQTRREAEAKYRQLAGTGKASHDLREILPAAYNGRVELLFVAVGRQEWGVYDAQGDKLQRFPQARPGAEDLLDAASIQTLLKGGAVFSVEPEAVPDGPPLAAVFRY